MSVSRITIVSRAAAPLFVGLMLFGCAEKPVTLVNGASQALEEAKKAGANEYAPETLREAENIFQQAQEELAIEEDKFVWERSYTNVQGMFQKVGVEANRAKSEALTNKEQAKSEAQAVISKAKISIDEARMILAKAPMGKGSQADLQALNGDLQTAESMLPELDAAMAKEDYLGVKTKAQAIDSLAMRVHNEVAHALQKTGKGKA